MEPQFIFYLIFFGAIGVFALLNWYKRKEEQELKALEFKIIAAEHNLEFHEDGASYLSRLRHRDLLPGNNAKITNVMTKDHGLFVTRVFDASHVIGSGKSSKTEYLTGIAVEFEDVVLPRFDLDTAQFLDSFNFFDNMQKVKNEKLPQWLQHNYSLFYDKKFLPHGVVNLFRDKEELKPHLNRPNFHLLAGASKSLVYYCKGKTQSTVDFFNRMDGIAVELAQLFYPGYIEISPNLKPDELHNEIKVLKSSEVK